MQLEKVIMPWRNIEPLGGYLSFSSRVSFASSEFQQNRHISRIFCVITLLANSNNHDDDDGEKNLKMKQIL